MVGAGIGRVVAERPGAGGESRPVHRCLHQSIDGSLELAHFVSTFRIDKTFWLYHIQLFFKKSRKEYSFDIHLPDFIKYDNC